MPYRFKELGFGNLGLELCDHGSECGASTIGLGFKIAGHGSSPAMVLLLDEPQCLLGGLGPGFGDLETLKSLLQGRIGLSYLLFNLKTGFLFNRFGFGKTAFCG